MESQRTNRVRRSLLVGSTAGTLLLGGALTGPPAAAVPDDGKGELVVTIVDASGRPTPSLVAVLSSSGQLAGATSNRVVSTYEDTLQPGRYGIATMAPWAGIACAGFTPCTIAAINGDETSTVTGVVDVADVETPAAITLRAPKPAVVTGGTAVRQVRRVTLSPEMRLLAKSLESFGGLRMQWLRDGKPIRGATRAAYRLRPADAGRKVAPRLSYAPDALRQWEQAEADASPRTLPGRVIDRLTSRVAVRLARVVRADRAAVLRVRVRSAGAPATGKVRVVVGGSRIRAELRKGAVRIVLPRLAPGSYQVRTTYLGSPSLTRSTERVGLRVVR